jgi:two-component system phosphate regulon sensor histidine kinase PhoR
MRIRLQVVLPLLVAALVALGFLGAALSVGDAVRDSLTTVPGLTADRAVEGAVRAVVLAGIIATAVAALLAFAIARLVASPLARIRRSADHLVGDGAELPPGSPVAEIQDVAREITRVTGELRTEYGRQLQERSELASLVEAVSEGIIQLDGDGRVVRLNRASQELLGLPEDAVGRPVAALFRNPELRQVMERAAAGKGTAATEVVVDEQRILVSAASDPRGGAVATLVDLTDLRRLEEVRRDFVANASHELKTPLTSIRGYTETLLGGELPESERVQFLATISRNAERLQRIVDDLLDLSRLESGRWQPDLERVDVVRIAESSWLGFADRAADQEVAFAVDGEEALAMADHRALEQIFANLYDNALRYTDRGGRVTVTTRVAEEAPRNGGPRTRRPALQEPRPGPWVVVEVSDTGSGIPRDALPRIFERFYRVDPARSRAEGGTGLGLSIVKHMLETMGGGVDAHSELGKGTTIRMWLPLPPG